MTVFGCSAKTEKFPYELFLRSGKSVEISVDRKNSPDQPKTLIVEISTEKKLIKEAELDEDVQEIWAKLEPTADTEEFEEAIIKYRYLTEDLNDTGELEKVFVISIFSAEKTENGKWKIDKIG